ncbi:hypothetical protein K432DRAFT_413728 [Lepidopterella palustris CBS 459.81]|uniref:Cell surface spherulin 4-like protein n=1 Tax=Lepidopterella palustris CBS 459.81 TaxID=1314670 RepID=A0A8E2JK04_9PEZI|nr:hypothetical protein K432DRAFT_413728 [Lepidopterella palustris CBS 459.81]
MTANPSVLLPLYIYPSPGAWDPLYQMASENPHLKFTVVINPNSGPGDGVLPDANYTRGISILNGFSNVRTIGYVATTWASKDVNAVMQEVATYAGWATLNSSIALCGVFFDETPAQYEPGHAQYLQTISDAVRKSRGLADGYVVHNPGSVPDARYYADPQYVKMANATVVFEETYQTWLIRESNLTEGSLPYDHGNLACLMHSVPEMTDKKLESLLEQVVGVGTHVYLTGTHNYTSFSPQFPMFVGTLNDMIH